MSIAIGIGLSFRLHYGTVLVPLMLLSIALSIALTTLVFPQLHKSRAVALYQLGDKAYDRNDFPGAVRAWLAAADEYPKDSANDCELAANGLIFCGEELVDAERLTDAERLELKAIQVAQNGLGSKHFTTAWALREYTYLKNYELAGCAHSLQALPVLKDAKQYVARGLASCDGMYVTAGPDEIKDWSKAITLDRNYAPAYVYRASAYFGHNKRKAIDDYTKAIQLDPKGKLTERAYWNLGTLYEVSHQYQKEIELCSQAILNVAPDSTEDYYSRRASIYGKLGQYQKEIDDDNMVIRLNPKAKWAYCSRGIAYGQIGEFDKDIADCDSALSLDPHYELARANQAQAQILQMIQSNWIKALVLLMVAASCSWIALRLKPVVAPVS